MLQRTFHGLSLASQLIFEFVLNFFCSRARKLSSVHVEQRLVLAGRKVDADGQQPVAAGKLEQLVSKVDLPVME